MGLNDAYVEMHSDLGVMYELSGQQPMVKTLSVLSELLVY